QFESGRLYGFHADEMENVPLIAINNGLVPAIEVTTQPMKLSDDITVSFRTIPLLQPKHTVEVTVDVTEMHEDGVVLEHPQHFGWGIRQGHIFKLWSGDLAKVRDWIVTVRYR